MKTLCHKPLFSLIAALGLAATSHTLQADTVFGIYAGAGAWQTEYDGDIGKPALTTQELGVDEKNNSFYYIAIEHPIPFLPNLKLQQNDLSSRQSATIEKSFELGGTDFIMGENVTTDFDLSYTDATLYYEFLDNWLNLDLGVTLRQYSGYVKAESAFSAENIDVDATAPLVYARFQFDLPFTGFSAGLEGNAIRYDGNTLQDYSAKIGYMFDSALDLGIELGYKQAHIKLNDDDVNLELRGPYAAAVFHF